VNLEELMGGMIRGEAERQRVVWSPTAWLKRSERFGLGWEPIVDHLAEQCDHPTAARQNRLLPRAAVHGVGDRCPGEFRPRDLLVACCVWGFGRHPRGRARTHAMLRADDVDRLLEDIVSLSRVNGETGFNALFSNWRPRVPGLGVAFGTKLVYFCAASGVRPRPLIYDRFVSIGLRDVSDRPFPPATGRVRTEDYGAYLALAEEVAAKAGVLAEDVEHALFGHGKAVVESGG